MDITELHIWHKCRPWFTDSPISVAQATVLENGMVRLSLRRKDQPGLTWFAAVPHAHITEAINGAFARRFYITNLARTITASRPRIHPLQLIRNESHGTSSPA